MELDQDAQPVLSLNQNRRLVRGMSELIGLIRGLAADRKVNQAEVAALGAWISRNGECASEWPANVIFQRLQRIYADNIVTDDECEELRQLLEEIIGGGSDEFYSASTDLPLCRPVPEVIFDRNIFVLTGKFVYGNRASCEAEIKVRGGECRDSVTLQTAYLVVGLIGSRDWKQTAWGTKIIRAVELQKSGPIHIISEQTWASYLMPGRAQ